MSPLTALTAKFYSLINFPMNLPRLIRILKNVKNKLLEKIMSQWSIVF